VYEQSKSGESPILLAGCRLAQIPAGKAVPLCRLPLLDSARGHGHAWLSAMGQHKNNKRSEQSHVKTAERG
jgi:hypothetical protein